MHLICIIIRRRRDSQSKKIQKDQALGGGLFISLNEETIETFSVSYVKAQEKTWGVSKLDAKKRSVNTGFTLSLAFLLS